MAQIQRNIALEAISQTVIEIYLERNPNKEPKLLAYYTSVPNPHCLDIPEKKDKYFNTHKDTLPHLCNYTIHTLAISAEHEINSNKYNLN